jgi:hypothetical protein
MRFSRKQLALMAAMAALVSFTACEDDDDDTNPTAEIPQVYQDLPGTLISQNTTWSGAVERSGKYYVLPGVTLTIAAGSTVSFTYHEDNPDDVGAIITLRGDDDNFTTERASGRLVANGTAAQPIIFTSARASKSAGDWGGIVLIGEAPNNIPGGTGDVEGLSETVQYGGTVADDNSGRLSYVRIEYCGYGIAADSELNGLSLYSVGSATVLDHVQVYKCTDDGFEWFGGTVSAKYLVSAYNDDDSFDMDEGWRGNGQFWLGVQAPGADNGFESDGRKTLGVGDPTRPVLSNVTLYGFGAGKDAEDKNYGMRLREDFQGNLSNFVIANFAGINWKLESADGDVTSANYDAGLLTIKRSCRVRQRERRCRHLRRVRQLLGQHPFLRRHQCRVRAGCFRADQPRVPRFQPRGWQRCGQRWPGALPTRGSRPRPTWAPWAQATTGPPPPGCAGPTEPHFLSCSSDRAGGCTSSLRLFFGGSGHQVNVSRGDAEPQRNRIRWSSDRTGPAGPTVTPRQNGRVDTPVALRMAGISILRAPVPSRQNQPTQTC